MSQDKTPLDYSASIRYDYRLYSHDIAGSIAHVRMLSQQGIIARDDAETIISGLSSIQLEIESGSFPWRNDLEDIHMNIETRLFEKIGDVAGRLHTARSRNDQVATDMRLYCKEVCKQTHSRIRDIQESILSIAETNINVVIPGYTHMQRGQPVLFAHHMLAYFEMFQRDSERFLQCHARSDVLPLGSGALAGVTYAIDRQFVAEQLGFKSISQNSMDAVSDRDFVVDYLAAAATCMMHISRWAEELVIWASQEFRLIRMNDTYTTGSSIMPQKRNPDFAELARGKTGRIYGNLIGTLTVLKGLPLTYNRDLQEDKESLFDTVDTLISTLKIFSGMVKSMQVNANRARQLAEDNYILATDLADYLVSKGEPFRSAHGILSRLVDKATSTGRSLSLLTIDEYQEESHLFKDDIFNISIDSSIKSRDTYGGTNQSRVLEALREARSQLESSDG